jgi:DNA-binding MarR family transcriptional regulator
MRQIIWLSDLLSESGVEGQESELRALSLQLNDPVLKSTARLLILISLGINRRLGFVDLLNLTGVGKGSLSNHLQKLESKGLIRVRRIPTFGGLRVRVEITQEGLAVYRNYLELLSKLIAKSNNV